MASRSLKPPKKVFKRGKRTGSVTTAERALVRQFVTDQPHEVTPKQVTALAQVLERTPATVRKTIEQAKLELGDQADRYVEIHMQATEGALHAGEFEAAQKGSQWALTHLSAEGTRVVEKAESGPTGTRVLVGINIGGIDADRIAKTMTVTPLLPSPDESAA